MNMQLDNSDGIIKVAEKLKEQADCIEQLQLQVDAMVERINTFPDKGYGYDALKKYLLTGEEQKL